MDITLCLVILFSISALSLALFLIFRDLGIHSRGSPQNSVTREASDRTPTQKISSAGRRTPEAVTSRPIPADHYRSANTHISIDRVRCRDLFAPGTILVHHVTQGTPEWFSLRLGIPTASQFGRIITPTGRPSSQSVSYISELIQEIATGRQRSFGGNEWTERGKELEPKAAQHYEAITGTKTESTGIFTDRRRLVGCSPDRLVGLKGLLEIKCPAPHNHVKFLQTQEMNMRYYPQVQGQLLVTGREWVDFFSYHPEHKCLTVRIYRNEQYLAVLTDLLHEFIDTLNQRRIELGHPSMF